MFILKTVFQQTKYFTLWSCVLPSSRILWGAEKRRHCVHHAGYGGTGEKSPRRRAQPIPAI